MLQSNIKDELTQQFNKKIEILPQLTIAITSILFQQTTKIFGIGKSVEEVFLLRSIFYYNLQRFNVIEPLKRASNS